jgi:hypothetical protein
MCPPDFAAIPPTDDGSPKTDSRKSSLSDLMMAEETAFDLTTPYFSQSDLLKRGWSKRLIAQMLGKRDWESPNPHYPGAAPMKCWRQDRVIAAEDTPAFRERS